MVEGLETVRVNAVCTRAGEMALAPLSAASKPSNAQKIVENALTLSNNKVDAILAPNDGTASGAIAALEAQGLAGKVPVTGMDAEVGAAQRVVKGTQSITVLKDTRKLGEEAIRLANDTEYGLVSYVFTEDLKRGQRLIDRIETGMMGLNIGVLSNAAAPFGGVKMSGIGREGGFEGIEEYLYPKYTLTPNPYA